MTTYYNQIVQNLENLRHIAIFHPRLAYLGVSSEIEIVLQEIMPNVIKEVAAKEVKKRRENRQSIPPFPDNSAVRSLLRQFEKQKVLSDGTSKFLKELFGETGAPNRGKVGYDGACRHTRAKMSRIEANKAIDRAVVFISELRKAEIENYFLCAACKEHHDFPLEPLFDTIPGKTALLTCRKTGRALLEYKVPSALEPALLEDVFQDFLQRETIIKSLGESLKYFIGCRYGSKTKTEKADQIRLKILSMVLELGEEKE